MGCITYKAYNVTKATWKLKTLKIKLKEYSIVHRIYSPQTKTVEENKSHWHRLLPQQGIDVAKR
jgi:hypothetical protein